jgi:hypothetical protein
MFLFFFLNLLVVAVISAAKPIEMHQAVGGVSLKQSFDSSITHTMPLDKNTQT